jgi:hypothetical protein
MKTSSVWFKALLLVAVFAGVASASRVGAATAIVATARTKQSAVHQGGGVSSHIVLPSHSLVSGRSEHGTLVIGNSTGRAIRWNCAYLEVQLTNAHRPLEMHPTPCGPARTLHVGTTRLAFTLWASQNVCEASCKALPPGTYHTQVFPGVPAVVHPAAIAVHVAKRPGRRSSGTRVGGGTGSANRRHTITPQE